MMSASGSHSMARGGAQVRVGLHARVSSDQQAQQQTIASQLSALRERVHEDGCEVCEALCFVDDGVSGATLLRPALEKLRDTAYTGGLDRLYVHSPDRLARKYAWQVLLVEELRSHGVEIVFLNYTIGASPEEDLLLQMQGMFAEYERAKILERSRRGKRHAARRGSVNVLSGAPYGYRYITRQKGGGTAAYEIIEEQAVVVRQVFEWVGRDRLSIGEVARRLKEEGVLSATGKTWWDRTSVCGMLKNPAYKGSAAFGKTRLGERRQRPRPQRGHSKTPRRTGSVYDTPPDESAFIDVPALVDEALFETVQDQLDGNRRQASERKRGARYLLQGLVKCACCGYSSYGTGTGSPRKDRRCREALHRPGREGPGRQGGQPAVAVIDGTNRHPWFEQSDQGCFRDSQVEPRRVSQAGHDTGRQLTTVYDPRWLFRGAEGEIVRKRMFYLWGLGCLVVLGALAWRVTARAGYESAPYEVVESDGDIEVREYPDLVLASTEAKFDARGNDGSFMRLFRYISGNNEMDQKIGMTTPVFMEPDSPESKGQMGFVMPKQIAEAGAPAPKASDVAIHKREGGRFAVIRFSGVMDAKKAEMQESKLREWLKARGIEGEETAERAGYDPPFTPSPLRRNEVLIRLKSVSEPASANPSTGK